jgi:large subunit ribosomal protein L19
MNNILTNGWSAAFALRFLILRGVRVFPQGMNIRKQIKEEFPMNALEQISKSSMKENVPEINVGDTVRVQVRIQEADGKYRLQAFEGTVIAKKHGGISETFTVRRVAHGVGIERVFPVHSPAVDRVEIVRKGVVRRAKLYYLRGRVGKAAKVKGLVR